MSPETEKFAIGRVLVSVGTASVLGDRVRGKCLSGQVCGIPLDEGAVHRGHRAARGSVAKTGLLQWLLLVVARGGVWSG